MPDAYALIMAGGSGTRLWPLSRTDKPKPVLPLVETERSMFQIAVERLSPLFPPERIMVVANPDLTGQLQAQAAYLPVENFIIEPSPRDTAPAVALGALHIHHRDPDAIMAVLTADHFIADEDRFRQVLATACQVAANGGIVTLGIEPDHPATGFGYIERAEKSQTIDDVDIYQLARFTEKPDEETARHFLETGNYSWNSGMFIWQARRVLAEFENHQPEIYTHLEGISTALDTSRYNDLLMDHWSSIKKISVDFALMEHIRNEVYVIPVQMGWADIGNFGALYDILAVQSGENVIRGKDVHALNSQGVFVHSQRLVAAIGLEDIVIIDTEDVLLVCKKEHAQQVKTIVEQLRKVQRNSVL